MKICVLGCGAYGTALATILDENKNDVVMWTAFEKEEKEMKKSRRCKKLPGIVIPDSIKISSDLKESCENKDMILIAVPAGAVNEISEKIKDYVDNATICIAAKGIEQGSCKFLYDVVREHIDTDDIAVISGPSFAIDVASKAPVGLTLATTNDKAKETVEKSFTNSHFKLRYTDDIIGTEICGSIKNVIAIAAGILDGLNMPESTSALLITESIHDIKELIKELGGDGKTVLSFAGFGDLLLTATSEKSRNYSFGKLLGGSSKEKVDEYIKNTTIEGLYTLDSISQLIKEKDINVPIINLVYDIIYNNESPNELLNFLIQKP